MDELSQTTQTYREIKRRIVELEYRLGERLSETRLASELGVGRSPVRSALAQLRSEGWVAISPQSGTFVKALTNRDIEEVTELRIVLEMHATRTAAERITQKEISALHVAFDTLGPSITAGRSELFIDLDKQLHQTIYKAAGNELVFDILRNAQAHRKRGCLLSCDCARGEGDAAKECTGCCNGHFMNSVKR
jgi:DNA-binding GntR family transcriptional regulator